MGLREPSCGCNMPFTLGSRRRGTLTADRQDIATERAGSRRAAAAPIGQRRGDTSRAREGSAGMVEWERRELVVRLGVELDDAPIDPQTKRRCQDVIDEALREAAAEGWEPDGATDWEALWRDGAIARGERRSVRGRGGHV